MKIRKNKKFYLLGFILFLYISFLFQGIHTLVNELDAKGNKIIINVAGNSHTYEWYRTWGGVNYDYGSGLLVDSLDNIYLVGYTENFGAGLYDMFLVKYDGNGVQQWNRTWGGASDDVGYSVAMDSLDNIYLAGDTYSFGAGENDMFLVKYDGNGVQQWNRTWGGTADDYGWGVAVDSLDNIYLAGDTYSFGAGENEVVLVKYNGNGVQQWNRTCGGASDDVGYSVAIDSLDNIYLAGETYSFGAGYRDMVLVKYNGNGVQQWNRTWGGASYDVGYSVAMDSLDNIYLAGETYSFGAGYGDMVLVKYNGNGVQQWNRTWGGTADDYSLSMVMDSLDNIYLAGDTYSFGVGIDMVLVKYNGNGVQQWNVTWGGGGIDIGYNLAMDSSDNIYLAGETSSFGAGLHDMVLVKYNGNGMQQWNRTWGGGDVDYGYSVAMDSLDNIYFAGETYSFGAGIVDMVLVKYSKIPEINIYSPSQNEEFSEKAPDYNISIIEPNLESMWYTIDGGITNYTIYQVTGTINQTAWDSAPYGSLTIRFYAKNLAGNIGYSEVDVQKVQKVKKKISGYQLLLLLSVIGLITAISLKKKYS